MEARRSSRDDVPVLGPGAEHSAERSAGDSIIGITSQLHRRTIHRAERMAQIDDLEGPLEGHGGAVAELLRAKRPEP